MTQTPFPDRSLGGLNKKIDQLFSSEEGWHQYRDDLKVILQDCLHTIELQDKDPREFFPYFSDFADLVKKHLVQPHLFGIYHQKIVEPYDYYQFSLSFFRFLIDLPRSTLLGMEHVREIDGLLERGENVILLSNHQIEPDPIVISILLEPHFPNIVQRLLCVSGERVTADPLTVPFSLGCNLLRIYSKKYIHHPPEKRGEKQRHNQKTMQKMMELLNMGGHIIYVAPSGGRDRPNAEGKIEVASCDSQSIAMLQLMARSTRRSTHFYTLALSTYPLLPPPKVTRLEIGEKRLVQSSAVHLAFGSQVDLDYHKMSAGNSLQEKRKLVAERVWRLIKEGYDRLSTK